MNPTHRKLTKGEIAQLESQGNYSDDWSSILVADPFCVNQVRNSTLRNCTLGANVTIRDVRLLSDYTLGDNVTLFNIGEMTGGGTPKPLEVMNENGGRAMRLFAGMTIGDAYLWARYRGRRAFMEKLESFTPTTSRLSLVGDHCTIKNTTCIRNTSICSNADDPTTIDGAIALCDGVVGYGCTVGHGVIAERFLLGEHVHLEFGLRLNDTVVGDNSTLARCEVGNSIIFPAHEQHHNNSFLIAGLIMGQSNIAAGCTIGSNHNSRSADNELVAGRGFWPGLCCSFKHPSRFASYCLVAKGDYPSELDIKLPFALVNNNVSKDQLEVMPAYWWMYNMYAMDRNSRKFAERDKRMQKEQNIEFDPLAPDTVEEILRGMQLLKGWIKDSTDGTVYGKGMENSKRPTVILKAKEGLKAYEEMLVFYAMNTLESEEWKVESGKCETEWINIGGQLVAKPDMEQLIADVESHAIDSWDALNERLNTLWQGYPAQKAAHAYAVLCELAGVDMLDDTLWQQYKQRYADIQNYIEEQKVASRKKDDENPFRRMTFWDDDEMRAVLG